MYTKLMDSSSEDVKVGQVFRRANNKEFYDLKDIFSDKMGNEYFSFYSFVIKHRKNLKRHFCSDSIGKLEVYSGTGGLS